ncbi:MAG: beta-glucosidase, partial [Thermotoga sp.]
MKENLYEGKIEELLSEMPIDEKIAQLGSVWVYELFENGRLSVDKMKELIGNGIGEITRLSASGLPPKDNAHLANEIQKFLKENTRPGIPAIFHEECLNGYMAK